MIWLADLFVRAFWRSRVLSCQQCQGGFGGRPGGREVRGEGGMQRGHLTDAGCRRGNEADGAVLAAGRRVFIGGGGGFELRHETAADAQLGGGGGHWATEAEHGV